MTYRPFPFCGTRCVLITASDATERIAGELRNKRITAAMLAIKSLDYLEYAPHDTGDAVKEVSRLIVPDLADWCIVDRAEETGFFRHVTVASPRWSENEPIYEICSHIPRETATGITHDIARSDPIITTTVPESVAFEVAFGEEPLGLKWRIRPASFAILPLPGLEKGTLTLILTESRPPYAAEERQWMEELARGVARIIDSSTITGGTESQAIELSMDDFICAVARFRGKDLRIVEANQAFARMTGKDEREVWGRKLEEVVQEAGGQAIACQLREIAETGYACPGGGYLIVGQDQDTRHLRYSLAPIRKGDRMPCDVMLVCFDATEEVAASQKIPELEKTLQEIDFRVSGRTEELASENMALREEIDARLRAELELREDAEKTRRALEEKEALLKETNHRAKNNMQILNSLISLQINNVADESARAVLLDSQSRIKSMALIHEKLYQSADDARIDFRDYVEVLARGITSSYNREDSRIRLALNVEKVFLDINTTVHCGLIINELITNSYKHGFKDDMNGEIRVDLTRTNQGYLLVVSDNGVGLPESVDIDNSLTLGLQLVRILVDQIGGRLEISRSWGTMFRISFDSDDLR